MPTSYSISVADDDKQYKHNLGCRSHRLIGTISLLSIPRHFLFMFFLKYGSPLAAMEHVVRIQNVEFLPFTLSFAIFANEGIWTIHSLLSGDYFVGIPNGIGFMLGQAQFMVFVIDRSPGQARQESAQIQPLPATYLENEGRLEECNAKNSSPRHTNAYDFLRECTYVVLLSSNNQEASHKRQDLFVLFYSCGSAPKLDAWAQSCTKRIALEC